jgi:hypothetical protein
VPLSYLHRHISEPIRTCAVLDGIEAQYNSKFDRVTPPAVATRAGRLGSSSR